MTKQQAAITFCLLLGGCISLQIKSKLPISDHYDGEHFFNPWGANNTKSIVDVLKWRWSADPQPWPDHEVANTAVPQLVKNGQAASIHVTFIGHATTYIQDSKHSILTDPQFSERSSPVSFAGPMRVRKPGVEISHLPAVDLVVISHNHYDHLDLPTLIALDERFHPEFVVPLGNGSLLRDAGIQQVIELDWWQHYGDVQLVPAQHWSARGLFDRNKALWGGYVLTLDQRRVFFAGDTGYGPHFKMIRQRCGPIDITILPIGAYEPRWFMKVQHMNPDDAVLAHLDLESKQSFAIHFETFRLTDEGYAEPRQTLFEALSNHKLSRDRFFVPEVGETLIVK